MTVRRRRKIGEKRETHEETRTTERKSRLVNLAYLAEHRISIFYQGELDS